MAGAVSAKILMRLAESGRRMQRAIGALEIEE